MNRAILNSSLIVLLFFMLSPWLSGQDYSWQKPHAKVIPSGDLEWAPLPFSFPAEDGEFRYIDYENGDDMSNGLTKSTPWKHHPWDTRASGNSAACEAIVTYVFKGGVTYRLFSEGGEAILRADDSGLEGQPIRLTSDPEWGNVPAIIAGSKPLKKQWKKAGENDVPKRMEIENVWYIDINSPRRPMNYIPPTVKPVFGMWELQRTMNEVVLFSIDAEGNIEDLHIASDVGWDIQNPNFAYHHWNKWDGEGNFNVNSDEVDLQAYDDALKGLPVDYFNGGTLWSQWGGIIATAHPYILKPGDYDPDRGYLAHRTHRHANRLDIRSPFDHWVHKDSRYLIENLPQFMDQPGEYYFDKDFGEQSGRLFLKMDGSEDPNNLDIEISTAWTSISISGQKHIEISGLTFQFNGRKGNAIEFLENASHIHIRNCTFRHLSNDAIYGEVKKGEKMEEINITDNDFFRVNGGTAVAILGDAGDGLNGNNILGELTHVNVLRNRIRESGLYRHNDHRWSNVYSIGVMYGRIIEVAGNIVTDAMGSGIVVQGGKTGKDGNAWDLPFIRILVHHNKIEYAALGVCDYGGLSLWQHGPLFSYSNISGNSVGHWPGGLGWNTTYTNLSYPIYLDGGFKIYNFNNLSWARPHEKDSLYLSDRGAFFNVFGYLNPFINNTVYGSAKGIGGTSGNRNNYVGNIFADITREYISVNHGGNPSLIGGDDPGTSGIDGASTLSIGKNYFHGGARAGTIATIRQGAKKDLSAEDIPTLSKQMTDYPVALGEFGTEVADMPLSKPIPYMEEKPGIAEADFRPSEGFEGINNGIDYFVPWALYGTVAEWNFNLNHGDPELILDFHHYPTDIHFHRKMYYKVPVFEIEVNEANQNDYTASETESWVKGALLFDGTRYASLADRKTRADVKININDLGGAAGNALPGAPWITPKPAGKDQRGKPVFTDDQFITYPGELRKSPNIKTSNFLVEAIIRVDKKHKNGVVLGKHDGKSGYLLEISKKGEIAFSVASGNIGSEVSSPEKINDGEWHHVIAEMDRQTGRMTIYLDGKKSSEINSGFPVDLSLSNDADLYVGRDITGKKYFKGAIDFMRISLGTLADAETNIRELYAWQFDGPVKYDFAGNEPKGRRDAGALEKID